MAKENNNYNFHEFSCSSEKERHSTRREREKIAKVREKKLPPVARWTQRHRELKLFIAGQRENETG